MEGLIRVPRTRLVLFDVDGTLVSTGGSGKRAFDTAFRDRFGRTILEGPANAVAFAGRTDPSILDDLIDAVGVSVEVWKREREAFLTTYFKALERDLAAAPPGADTVGRVEVLLERLDRVAEVHLGLLTGNFERGARLKLGPFDLNRYFATGGFGSDHRDRRHVASISARRTAEHAGVTVKPEQVVVVGDTVHDIDCARANGYRSIAIAGSSTGAAPLCEAGACRVVDAFDPPDEILEFICA